ncbi:MAG: hypothetical protein ACQESF_06110 [Nanobdellota archaeon]
MSIRAKDLKLKEKRIFFWERNRKLPTEIENLEDNDLFLETGAVYPGLERECNCLLSDLVKEKRNQEGLI